MSDHLKLQELLLELPKDGKAFERLVARALEEVLGRRVWVSGGGYQSGGDMVTDAQTPPVVRLEAKRYSPDTALYKRELLGEVTQAVQNYAGLDLWILATTRDVDAGLQEQLRADGSERGIGIEILDLSASPKSGLALLLASTAEETEALIHEALGPDLASRYRTILEGIRDQCGTADELRSRVIRPESYFGYIASRARQDLRIRAGNPQLARKSFGQVLPGTTNVRRQEAFEALEEWYDTHPEHAGAFLLHGEEGVGKTWAAIDWTLEKSESEQLLPITLSSSDAAAMVDLDQTLAAWLVKLFRGTSEQHWRRRVSRWLQVSELRNRILLMIDGLNQSPRSKWRKILHQIFLLEDPTHGANPTTMDSSEGRHGPQSEVTIAALITCRTGFWEEKIEPLPDFPVDKREISGFTDSELSKFLQRSGRRLQEFTNREVRDLLKIPRYSDLVVQHYDRLVESGEITKDSLLFEDWRDRFERKVEYPLSPDAFRQLLVDVAERTQNRQGSVPKSELRAELPLEESEEVLAELTTSGVIECDDRGRLRLEPNRLYHALGFLLLDSLLSSSAASEEEIRELIAQHLQPAALDAHASICTAAIFAATKRATPEQITRELFAAFLSLQNIAEQWTAIAGFFPVFPEIYRELVERSIGAEKVDEQEWNLLQYAYLKWCDVPSYHSLMMEHCRPWLTLLPLQLPQVHYRESKFGEEYQQELKEFIGCDLEEREYIVHGSRFRIVDSTGLSRYHSLGRIVLSGVATRISPDVIRDWALRVIAARHGSGDSSMAWVIRFLDRETTTRLRDEIDAMLRIEHRAWQHAAYWLAGLIPDGSGQDLRARSTHRAAHLDLEDTSDPCYGTHWSRENCAECLRREDQRLHWKVVNIANQSIDPQFTLPKDIESLLIEGMEEKLEGIDIEKLHRSGGTTEADIQLREYGPAFSRWTPTRWADANRKILRDVDLNFDYSDTDTEGDSEGEKSRQKKLWHYQQWSSFVESIILILSQDDIDFLWDFWSEHVRHPLGERKSPGSSDAVDFAENDLHRAILAVADPDRCVELIRIRPASDPLCRGDTVDALPLCLNQDQACTIWESLFDRSINEVKNKSFFFLLEEPSLKAGQVDRLVELAAADDPREVALFAVISSNKELMRKLVARGQALYLDSATELYWLPDEAVFNDLSLEALVRSSSIPILSHLIPGRSRTDAEQFAYLLRSFVENGEDEWHAQRHWTRNPRKRWPFSLEGLRAAVEAEPTSLDYLVSQFNEDWTDYPPERHSYQLYIAICEHLLSSGDTERGVPMLDRLASVERETSWLGQTTNGPSLDVLRLMARTSMADGVTARLCHYLDTCVFDRQLKDLAALFETGSDDWLWQKIETDLGSDRALIVARAMMLAGFACDSDRAVALLKGLTFTKGAWLDRVRRGALQIAERDVWARHWFSEFISRTCNVQAWAAFKLFEASVDWRYSGWGQKMLEKHGHGYRDRSRKMAHLRLNEARIWKKIEKYEEKTVKEKFCLTKIAKQLFPWNSKWKLSPEDQPRNIIGRSK